MKYHMHVFEMDSEVKKERKKYMGWLLSGIMFGGVVGVFMTCIVIAGGRGDEVMERARMESEWKKRDTGSKKVIRFVDRFNHSLFYIEDGDPIQLITSKGERKICICHYLDDLHARIDGKEWAMWEFARQMAKNDVIYMPLKMRVEKRKGGAA